MKVLDFARAQQAARWPWVLLIVVTVGLTCVAHYFFQDYLYMQPCEQCVYIRFAMLAMALGGLAAVLYPSQGTRVFAYILGFYGCIIGIEFCIKLHAIHEAVHAADAFGGVEGCREVPIYPFNLPLHEWAPDWFRPTGDCGLDNPIVPEDAVQTLSSLQQWFVGTVAGSAEEGFWVEDDGFYSAGWYLIPSAKFMDMAIACLLCFGCCFVALLAMFAGFVSDKCPCAKKGAVVVIIGVAVLYFAGNAMKNAEIERQANSPETVALLQK